MESITSQEKLLQSVKKMVVHENSFSALNDDCLLYIFSLLPIMDRIRIHRVCRRWLAVSKMPGQGLKRLDLLKSNWAYNENDSTITLPIIKEVLNLYGSSMTHLDFSFDFASSEYMHLKFTGDKDFFSFLTSTCPNLRKVDLSRMSVAQDGLMLLAHHCNHITELTIRNCEKNEDDNFDNIFSELKKLRYLRMITTKTDGQCFSKLSHETIEEISLESMWYARPTELCQVLQRCHKLHTLVIKHCPKILEKIDNILEIIAVEAPDFRTLTLNDYSFNETFLHPFSISKLTNLKNLELSGDAVLNDDILCAVGNRCLELQHGIFSLSKKVTSEGLRYINKLPKLKYLQTTFLSNAFLTLED